MRLAYIFHGFVILYILLFAFAPVISVAIAGSIAQSNGCDLDEGSVHPCVVNGQDIGQTLYTLGVLGWLMLATIPLGLGALVVYIAVVVLFYVVRHFWRKNRAQNSPAQAA